MEEDCSIKLISLSDLLHHSRPLTGASSLPSPIHPPRIHKDSPKLSDEQSPNSFKILKPLDYPTFLVGTLNLFIPSFSCSNSSCLKFSDHSAAVCCDILDLDLRVIGHRIKVLAWNFFPVKPHSGFLEIIRWGLVQSENDCIQNFNAFCLNSALPTFEESIVPRHLVYGLLESVSPVTSVPCTAKKKGTKNLNGFLAEVAVCECESCSSGDRVTLPQELTGEHHNDHSFSKSKILYFCGSASILYPAISRLIGSIVLISGMKKKMVFIGEGKPLMMHVTTDKSILHLLMSTGKKAMNGRNTSTRQKRLCSFYTGSITEVYMQGMVIELDQKVLLLLTDHQISLPHSLRVGAIITVRNFHVEDPKFAWTNVIVYGSCYRTSIRVKAFSPIETGCYQTLQSRSLLRKFIESLTFSARLWVLLVVSSIRKKFAGVLSEMEILGSKHMEGLVQKYSSSHLPLSVFRFRHGVFSEYCLHDLGDCGKEIDYNSPKLVVPISNFVYQCEDMFIRSLCTRGTDSDMNHRYSLVCGGKSHNQPIRKILKSEDMNVVLLGNLKISEYSGRLQLFDATSSIDVVVPDLPSVWSIKDIYEIHNFIVVMEGFPPQLEHLELISYEPFSCGNIFNHFHLAGRKGIKVYVHCYMRDAKSRNNVICPGVDRDENFKELESGRFHLLFLVHKFPVQQKFPGVLNNPSIYAEAIILPWNLLLHNRGRDSVESSDGNNVSDNLNSSCDEIRRDFNCLNQFPCTIECHNLSMVRLGNLLNYAVAVKKLLLEFKSDSFWKYETLRICSYYLIKHHDEDLLCNAKNPEKVFVNSQSHFWSVSFAADVASPTIARSCISSNHNLNSLEEHLQSPNAHQVNIPVPISTGGCPEICPDIYLHMSAEHLSFLEVKLRELKQELIQPINSIKELLNSSWIPQTMKNASPFGANLPAGNFLYVQGKVVAVHRSYEIPLVSRLSHRILHGARHHIVPGVTNSDCIHVLVDHNIVKIYSSLSEQSYPVGFGPGVKANFHRVLLTAEGNVLKLTPASFIEINSILMDDDQCGNEGDETSVRSAVVTASSLTTGPVVLISEIMQFSDHTQMRLHCKVLAIYVLVLEKNSELQQFSNLNSEIPCVKIPLAGFIMDDGSSSCCCWVDNERAVTLLGSHERLPHKRSRSSLRQSNKKGLETCSNSISSMSKILDQHGTVVLKNHGSVSDSSCLDVAISITSDSVVRGSDEEFLRSLIFQACSRNTWNVVGSVLDSKTMNHIEEHLRRLDMMMPPLQNVWASEVSHLDTLKEGRSILQELLKLE